MIGNGVPNILRTSSMDDSKGIRKCKIGLAGVASDDSSVVDGMRPSALLLRDWQLWTNFFF